jgi:hypothetical protein
MINVGLSIAAIEIAFGLIAAMLWVRDWLM